MSKDSLFWQHRRQGFRNLFYSVENLPNNPLVHIFLYITLACGICFLFFAEPSGASSTMLYQLTEAKVGSMSVNIWGASAVISTFINTIAYVFRRKWLGRFSCYLGFAVWGFAFFVYMFGGFYFGMMALALPNLMFWCWQFIQVGRYHKMFHPGLYPKFRDGTMESIANRHIPMR